ncbi:cytochrome P450 [Mycobacterium sp. pV006]|uniref:cytochrome P450 n=1 Tax=Mycobacterium sp. pV006 TaxID=3238983 RepID=UPI00351B31E5
MAKATTDPVKLPPGPRLPKVLQGAAFLTAPYTLPAMLARRYGGAVSMRMPVFGQTVVVTDSALVKDLFSTGNDLIERPTNLGRVVGPGSMWSLNGKALVERRKLLVPPFHGKRVGGYERIVEEEVMREIATWPQGQEFETLNSMMRITLNVILRTVFGAQGPELDELREVMPASVELGSRLAMLPDVVLKDLGAWSPGGRIKRYRQRIDAVTEKLMADARSDPDFDGRSDILTLLLAARYEDGQPISDSHITDELVTLMAAGHETTSLSLAWGVERLRRHPELLSRLVAEVDAGGSELRQATIWEIQRTRPVVNATMRRTLQRIRLGDWVIPEDSTLLISIELAQQSAEHFPDPEAFNPDRYLVNGKTPPAWVAFGGGIYRCIGAAFANMEMDVALRTMLRELRFETTTAPAERRHSRGTNMAPEKGGRAVVYRRPGGALGDSESLSVSSGSDAR